MTHTAESPTKDLGVRQIIKFPELLKVVDDSEPKIDNSKPGCFGGKNFFSPRNNIRKDSILENMKDSLQKLTKT
jgi:hypothetical protein